MPQSQLADLAQSAFSEKIERLIKSSQNPLLTKAILFRVQHSPGCVSNNILANSLKVTQEEVDALLPFLAESGLVELKERVKDYRFPDWKWNVWRVDEIRTYLESEAPYGPHMLMKRRGLSDEQLLKAMNAVADIVEFGYNKCVVLPIDKLRKIRDESHEALNVLRQQECEKIYERLNINRGWTELPRFVEAHDDTTQEGYDVRRFTFYGRFPSPADALEEDFDGADADPPIDNEGNIWRVHMIYIFRGRKEANELTLYNSRYGGAANRSMVYQKKLTELLPMIQGKLEEALADNKT